MKQSKGTLSAVVAVVNSTPTPKLSAAITEFFLDRRIAGCTTATVSAYRFQLTPFLAWCGRSECELDTLTEDHIRTFLAERQRVSQATLHAACVRLKTFFRWAKQQGLCADPTERIRRTKQQQKLVPTLSPGQVRAMLALCPSGKFTGKRDAALVRLLLDTGLRISEALDVKLDRVDVDAGRVIVNGKGQKQRVAFFGPRTAKALLRYLDARPGVRSDDGCLFVTSQGVQMNLPR